MICDNEISKWPNISSIPDVSNYFSTKTCKSWNPNPAQSFVISLENCLLTEQKGRQQDFQMV